MNIVCVSDDYHNKFNKIKKRGAIHSVFKHVINFRVDDRLYTIGDRTVSMGPCTATLEEIVNFETWGFSRGDKVVFESEKVMIYMGRKEAVFNYKPQSIWQSQFDSDSSRLDRNHMKKNLESLLSVIVQSGDPDSIAPLIELMKPHFIWLEDIDVSFERVGDSRLKWIAFRFILFLKVIQESEWDEIASATRGVIGFGPGLTPSSDDFVVGMMTGLLYSDAKSEDILIQFKKLIQDIEGRTTDISYEALWHAAYGRVNELVRKAVLAVVSNGSIEDMKDLLRIGQTSGTDLMVGLYFGIKVNLYKGEH